MKIKIGRINSFGLVALMATCIGVHAQTCNLQLAASLDMRLTPEGAPVVPLTLNDQKVDFEIDTGTSYSMMSSILARGLGLVQTNYPKDQIPITFYGGQSVTKTTVVRSFKLGDLLGKDLSLRIYPDSLGFSAGLLGMDILGNYDIELDFYAGKVNLFLPHTCSDVVYWTKSGFARIPLTSKRGSSEPLHVSVPALLDGKKVTVELFTGSGRTSWSLEAARAVMGIGEKSDQLQPVPNSKTSFKYPFKTLSLGGVSVRDPEIALVPDKVEQIVKEDAVVLVGRNVLRQLHLYIAFKEKALYVTPARAY